MTKIFLYAVAFVVFVVFIVVVLGFLLPFLISAKSTAAVIGGVVLFIVICAGSLKLLERKLTK